jgi:hypothetical protein
MAALRMSTAVENALPVHRVTGALCQLAIGAADFLWDLWALILCTDVWCLDL